MPYSIIAISVLIYDVVLLVCTYVWTRSQPNFLHVPSEGEGELPGGTYQKKGVGAAAILPAKVLQFMGQGQEVAGNCGGDWWKVASMRLGEGLRIGVVVPDPVGRLLGPAYGPSLTTMATGGGRAEATSEEEVMSRKRKRERQVVDLNVAFREEREESEEKSASGQGSNMPGNATIILDDDEDDDVQVSSPQSIARARASASCDRRVQRRRTRNTAELHSGRAGQALGQRGPVYYDSSDDCVVIKEMPQVANKKQRQAAQQVPVRLACAICLDVMKEEMSTVCGHLFCRNCITAAIRTQKKCPSCRRKLGPKDVHRIYL